MNGWRVWIGALALVVAGCGGGTQEIALEVSDQPVRRDLGEWAPSVDRNQRLIPDVVATVDLPDGETYTFEVNSFWIVMDFDVTLEGLERLDEPVDYLEFRQVVGRDDVEMVEVAAELAAAVGYEFDVDAALEWVADNDEGFGFVVKSPADAGYALTIAANDKLTNTASVFIDFPSDSAAGSEMLDRGENPFNFRLIEE